jgi:hypothetical protein
MASTSSGGSVDGAEHIKVRCSLFFAEVYSILNSLRLTHSSEVLTGLTFIGTQRHTVLNFGTPRILATLIPIFQRRYVTTSANSMSRLMPLRLIFFFKPLAPANGAPADATRDPMLRDKTHGAEILDVRKALAFAGFTHKSPRAISYVRADKAFDLQPQTYGQQTGERGRSTLREMHEVGRGRAISM